MFNRTLVTSTVGACCLAAWVGAASPTFKSSTVRGARATLERSLQEARRNFDERCQAAHKKYAATLEAAIAAATREGDLAEANKLSQELQLLTAAPDAGGIPTLVGTWRMRWGPNGAATPYAFSDDGRVVRELKDAATQGVLRRKGDDLLVDFQDRSLMRVNLAGERLLLEYWEAAGDYPLKHPNLVGIGTRGGD